VEVEVEVEVDFRYRKCKLLFFRPIFLGIASVGLLEYVVCLVRLRQDPLALGISDVLI